jgi:hypothetical protein
MWEENLSVNLIGPSHAILSETCLKLIDYELCSIKLTQFQQQFEQKVIPE